ncbi:MAG: diguanylate cyclase [Gammaproteobacteria bacterium]|nr:diguanylate cyclase [Gammaproteobacteria bacterium]
MPDTHSKLATSNASIKNMTAPSLKNRLKICIFILVLPFFLLAGISYFFFQKSTNAFNNAIEDVVSDVIPVTELKDKIQQTVIPFNRYLESSAQDDKIIFLQLSNEIKHSLANPIKPEQQDHSLASDIYRSAYLSWRNAHRIAVKIFKHTDHQNIHVSHQLLQSFYQYIIETTLALDKLHLAMQDRVKIRFQKAKELKIDAMFLISFVFLLVYISTVGTMFFLNRSIITPIMMLEQWSSNYSRGKKSKPLKLHSYREFEYIASTYNKLSLMLHDDEAVLEQLSQKDELTQLYNKRYFMNRLAEEHNRHQRYNTRYCLMLIDVDHLGSISQNYGEHICDLTLIQISRMLENALRPTDFLARYEGDQFIIILPEIELHGTNTTAERIRNSVSECVFKINKFTFGVTVSIGFTQVQKNEALTEVLRCVDFSVQQAKLAGRNQVQYCDTKTMKSYKFQPKYLTDTDSDTA